MISTTCCCFSFRSTEAKTFCIPHFGHLNWSSFYSCTVLSVSRQECQVKAYNVNGKNVCESLPHIHAWLHMRWDPICVCIWMYMYILCIVYVLCVWVNPSPLALWRLCQADRVTWELNHLCLSHRPNRQADSNSLQLSGNGKDDPEIQRVEWQQHYKRMKDGEKNESDVRRGRCKMVLSLSCPSELLFSDSQSGIHWPKKTWSLFRV